MVSGPNSDDEKLAVEETGVIDGGKGGGNEKSNTPDIEKFDRIRAAIHDKRDGPTGGAACGRGPLSPPHNVFVGSGGVGMETNDGDGGDGKGGGAGDRVRLVGQWAGAGRVWLTVRLGRNILLAQQCAYLCLRPS